VSGGVITIVDPPFAGTGRSFAYGGKGDSAWTGGCLVLGGKAGTHEAGAGEPCGFRVDTRSSGGGACELASLTIDGGAHPRRFASAPADPTHGFDVGGNLVIAPRSELRTLPRGAPLRLQGDLVNDGLLSDSAGIHFGSRTGPSKRAQTVTGAQANFRNPALAKAPGCFTALAFDNVAEPCAVTFRIGNIYVTDAIAFTNGAVTAQGGAGRPDHHLYLLRTCAVSRANGFWVTGGKFGTMSRQLPPGASSFTFHVGDDVGSVDYSPMTVQVASNTTEQWLGVTVQDRVHPDLAAHPAPDHLTRYWECYGDTAGTFAMTLSFAYLPADVSAMKPPSTARAGPARAGSPGRPRRGGG
jgi:hypothetical protein